MNPDFTVNDQGSVILLSPQSKLAHAWLNRNIQAEPWQWLNGGLAIDHRMAGDILQAIEDEGLSIGNA